MAIQRARFDVAALQRNDPGAWKTHYADLVEMADAFLNRNYASIRHRADIRDEAVARLFRAVVRLRDPAKFRPFFYEILCRTANESLRIEKRRAEAERLHERISRLDHAPSAEEAAMLLLDLKRAFSGLSRLHQEICALRFQNVTWGRIGEALSRSYKSLTKEFQRVNAVLEKACARDLLERHTRTVSHFFTERAQELFGEARLTELLAPEEAPETPDVASQAEAVLAEAGA
ncbi:MAG: sigma-70 family RNA polymerase sigma factor [Planctomycetes bacterium]|nr:sigma-70 family RNA polymerase sigma factor [Planctomycetota bacterium]